MQQFLVFQVKAPLASFGRLSGERRVSDTRPRRSAIVGLLAAALGIERKNDKAFSELVSAIKVGFVALSDVCSMVDFHTVLAPGKRVASSRKMQLELDPKNNNTILTYREYLQNGHWLIAISGPGALLASLAQALEAPKFALYMGRKACVLSAFTAPRVVEAQTLEDAFNAWRAEYPLPLGAAATERPMHWDAAMPVAQEARVAHSRVDNRVTLARNSFQTRVEHEGVFQLEKGI